MFVFRETSGQRERERGDAGVSEGGRDTEREGERELLSAG